MSNPNEVRLSKESVDALKALNEINQTLKIVANNKELRSINETSTCACIINIEEELPRTLCIYELREFINTINIIDNPVLDFSNTNYVLIKSEDGRQKIKYVDGSENLINSYFSKNLAIPSIDLTVNVEASQLKQVMVAARELKLQYVGFKSDGETLFLTAFNVNNGSDQETNSFSVEVGETTKKFELYYKTEALKVLDGDCSFEISYAKISKITNGKREYWIGLDPESSYEEV